MRRALTALCITAAMAAGLFWVTTRRIPPEISAGRCHQCNVVLVSIDSLRRDHMSLYGYQRPTTPNIDAWAQSGLVFDNYFATSYLTPISEGSVHSGLYPEISGMTSFRHSFSAEVETLAQIFKRNGFRTAAFGTSPEFVNFQAILDGFQRGFDVYNLTETRLSNRRTPKWNRIEDFISKRRSRPFFLWLKLGDVHAPFGALAENRFADPQYQGPMANLKFFTNMQFYYDGKIYNPFAPDKKFRLVAWRGGKSNDLHIAEESSLKGPWPIATSKQDLQHIEDLYDNGVSEADREFGTLMDMLKTHGHGENTVVIVQAEHGESLGERGYIAHYDIHDESIHVPLIISSPALKPGQRSAHLASGVDVLPTLIQHLNLAEKPKQELDGRPLLSPQGEAVHARDEVYITRTPLWESIIQADGDNHIFDRFRALDDQVGFKDHAVRTLNAKLIHRTARLAEEQFSCWKFVSGKSTSRKEFEFYDLPRDPGEKQPATPATPAAKELMGKLSAWKASIQKRARKTAIQPALQDYQ